MMPTVRHGFRLLSLVAVAAGLTWLLLGLRGLATGEARSALLVSFGGTAAALGALIWWWVGRRST